MDAQIPGFVTPVHRALTEPILMGGAPRSIAIVNGTLPRHSASVCASGSLASFFGSSATWPPSGPPSEIPTSSRSSADTSVSPVTSTPELSYDESRRISPFEHSPRRFSAVGGPGR